MVRFETNDSLAQMLDMAEAQKQKPGDFVQFQVGEDAVIVVRVFVKNSRG